MGYYIRILGTREAVIHVDQLIRDLNSVGFAAQFDIVESEQGGEWTLLNIANTKGEPIAQIERDLVVEGKLGKEELDEFIENIKHEKPASAVKWLLAYFKKVKVIYAFQMLNTAFENENFEIITKIRSKIWGQVGGILQADGEGFSNEDGYHILWQFSDTVTGEWACAVRNIWGQWKRFKMDLGDPQQRNEFKKGLVPKSSLPL